MLITITKIQQMCLSTWTEIFLLFCLTVYKRVIVALLHTHFDFCDLHMISAHSTHTHTHTHTHQQWSVSQITDGSVCFVALATFLNSRNNFKPFVLTHIRSVNGTDGFHTQDSVENQMRWPEWLDQDSCRVAGLGCLMVPRSAETRSWINKGILL